MHPLYDQLRWVERSRKHVASCSLFDLYTSERSSARGKTGHFCILTAPDWVSVVPLLRTPAGEERFLMVRQYRHGADLVTTEFPAGLVETGEEPAHAAARELEEETGFRAGKMTLLNRMSPHPAFMTNWCSIFLAEDLLRVADASLDETEELETLQVSPSDLRGGLGAGELVNSLTMVAFLWFERAQAAASRGPVPSRGQERDGGMSR